VTDLETLANLAEVFGTLTIVGGLLFAVIQIRQYRQQLRETATLELMNKFQTPEFSQAFRTIRSMRENLPSSELIADNPETEAAAKRTEFASSIVGASRMEASTKLESCLLANSANGGICSKFCSVGLGFSG
jgi:hypothetical protein